MIRVLLVDDHQLVRAGLASLIDAEPDMTVVATASDGAEAIEIARREHPDVVLMDLSMPVMSGEAATARITEQVPGTAVVVLTAFSDQARIRDAVAAGASGYLLKDTDPVDLLRGLRDAAAGNSPLDVKVARTLLTTYGTRRPAAELTNREEQVLDLLSEGLSNRQIGRKLGIAERTVKSHLTSAYQRLGVSDRLQAAMTWTLMHDPTHPA